MSERKDNFTSIVIVGRDKFSPTEKCIKSVIENTPEPHELICVLGGAPEKVKKQLEATFNGQVQFIFEKKFLNPPQGRNIGLRASRGKYAILMDNDVSVHSNWLKPLIDCQKDTSAVMVAPLTLEDDVRIHTGANYLYITEKNGKRYGFKELSFHNKIVGDTTTLKRDEVDYGELHCQFIEVEPTLALKAFDENIIEAGECDSGLSWKKAGYKMYFEPKSVVNYMIGHPVEPEDIRFFVWRWDMRNILKGYEYFEKKWNIDITEYGRFATFLLNFQNKVGIFARLFPSRWAISLDNCIHRIVTFHVYILGKCASPWKRIWKKKLGYDDWKKYMHA